ncbi:tetratricopeptide repeat-containing sensor histidine kinase [Cognatitamlana onchidii]|uniref:tetratricopeptide repeat-containing sensor histidine kinase n=1 Tax=Cognatitamlana onchidii TaxID=2562860 RepID=UPI001456023D|nr:sensor histidine kinase [Algibacter onchidii]
MKQNDSLGIAFNNYSIGQVYRSNLVSDSAYVYYNRAEKIYRELEDKYNLARTLFGIAVIQTNEKDYTGSEVTSIEAISLLESLTESNNTRKYKSYIYNNLGIVFDELEQYDEAVKYYILALKLKRSLSGNFQNSIYNTLNNLADSYKRSGNYDLSINTYLQILENKDLISDRPNFYAMVLNNYANTLYLSGENSHLPNMYLRALKISDSLHKDNYNSIIISQHLAEYYDKIGLNDSALYYGYKAKKISEKYNNDDLLKSLLLLSKIEKGQKAADFLRTYVELSDSLQKKERAIRNKFARIRFETDQIEKENIQIAKERLWLLIVSVVVIIASFLLYLVIHQRNKNRELQFVQKQQETNEEIYNLMLSQNETIEEARTLEKKRISEELHDGVLGRLFGTRLSLDSLNMNNTPEAIKTRGQYIEKLKTIEEDIRKVSHELNTDFVSGSGFIDIIKTLVETQTLAYNLKYILEHDDSINWDDMSNKKKIHIYRIIQESLHNIYKHANATKVDVGLKLKNNVIYLTLADNGAGFDVSKAKSGIGLKNMNSRINEINGEIEITSEITKGTTVSIEIPIP